MKNRANRTQQTSAILSVARRAKPMALTIPSHSTKLTGGGGFFNSIRTTRDSTLGGGRKLF